MASDRWYLERTKCDLGVGVSVDVRRVDIDRNEMEGVKNA